MVGVRDGLGVGSYLMDIELRFYMRKSSSVDGRR